MGRRTLRLALAAAMVVIARAHPSAAAVSAHAVVDHDRVFVGDPFTLTIEVQGTQQAEVPDLGDVGPFDVSYIGPVTRFASVNGAVTTSVSHRYALTAKHEGTYNLGPFHISAGGSVVEIAAVEIQVTPRTTRPGSVQGDENVRLIVTADKTKAFVGERIPFNLELYVGDVVVRGSNAPTVQADGMVLDTFTKPVERQEIARNRRWTVWKFRSTATPLRPGSLTIGPSEIALEVMERARHRESLFDDLIAAGRARTLRLSAEPVAVDVRPLPTDGRPPDFGGAIGQFDFTLDAQPKAVTAGDPITVRIEIKGFGNVESIAPPRVPVGREFRAYDPTRVADASGPGRLAVEQVLIPRDQATREIPAVSFSFFEPESGTYRTITRGPIPVTVRAAPGTHPAVIGGAVPAPKTAPEKLGRDIVYIKDNPGRLGPRRGRFYTQWWFAGVQAAPLLVAGLLALAMRRRRALSADPRIMRQQRAGRTARRRLAALSKGGRGKTFYDELTAAVAGYLADKLDLAPGAVDRESVGARLDSAGAADGVRADAARFFDVVERARYAPGTSGDGDPSQALELARSLVRGLERDRAVARRLAVVSALLALLVTAAILPALAESPAPARQDEPRTEAHAGEAHAIFYQGNTAYRDGDHEAAVRAYEQLSNAGFESGALEYNLGNAYFKRGKYGQAVLAYERARRLLPRDADVRANLTYARDSAKAAEPTVGLWQRVVFAPAFAASTAELAILWSALWWGAWTLVVLRVLGRATGRGAPAWALSLAVIVVGAGLVFRLWRFDFGDEAIVTAPGSNVARFEPSAAGKEYFRLPEGSLVKLRQTRTGWVQIARVDGLRGWMPADAVAPIEQ